MVKFKCITFYQCNKKTSSIISMNDTDFLFPPTIWNKCSGYFSSRGEIYEDSKVFIEGLKYEHLQQIIQFAKSRGYTFKMSDIHFVGGGSITLRRYIKQEFTHSVILDSHQNSNYLSFLKILEIKYGQY